MLILLFFKEDDEKVLLYLQTKLKNLEEVRDSKDFKELPLYIQKQLLDEIVNVRIKIATDKVLGGNGNGD